MALSFILESMVTMAKKLKNNVFLHLRPKAQAIVICLNLKHCLSYRCDSSGFLTVITAAITSGYPTKKVPTGVVNVP